MKKVIIIDIISYLLILLFSYAAVSKLSDYSNFKVQLLQSPITTGYATLIARFLPPVELLIAGALVVPGIRLPGLYASLFLMSVFTAYIAIMLQFSFYIPCSCGGILNHLDWKTHLWFNIIVTLLNTIAILLETIRRNNSKII